MAKASRPASCRCWPRYEALSHPGFWLLNLGFLACGFQLAFIASHLPAYLIDRGMRPADGVAALAIFALANVAGIYVFGLLGGRHSKKYLLAGRVARSLAVRPGGRHYVSGTSTPTGATYSVIRRRDSSMCARTISPAACAS